MLWHSERSGLPFVFDLKTQFIRTVVQLIDTLSASVEVRKQVPWAEVDVDVDARPTGRGEWAWHGPETQILEIENFPLFGKTPRLFILSRGYEARQL